MDRKTAANLIEQNLKTIYAWVLTRVYDKSDAEDLAQDIICAILKSVHRLECDEAFYGYMWKIASYTFQAYLRKKQPEAVELSDDFCGAYWRTPGEDFEAWEEIQLLRRELSLLSEMYRKVTVAYYFFNKSCAEIAAELEISTEMVKYYLFKSSVTVSK